MPILQTCHGRNSYYEWRGSKKGAWRGFIRRARRRMSEQLREQNTHKTGRSAQNRERHVLFNLKNIISAYIHTYTYFSHNSKHVLRYLGRFWKKKQASKTPNSKSPVWVVHNATGWGCRLRQKQYSTIQFSPPSVLLPSLFFWHSLPFAVCRLPLLIIIQRHPTIMSARNPTVWNCFFFFFSFLIFRRGDNNLQTFSAIKIRKNKHKLMSWRKKKRRGNEE